MPYKIECYVKTLSSDGSFTVRGVDGYYLERGEKAYNVFWKERDNKNENDKAELKKISEGFKVPTDGRQWELQTLLIAKGNNQKILVEVDEGKFYDSSVEIHKITLY